MIAKVLNDRAHFQNNTYLICEQKNLCYHEKTSDSFVFMVSMWRQKETESTHVEKGTKERSVVSLYQTSKIWSRHERKRTSRLIEFYLRKWLLSLYLHGNLDAAHYIGGTTPRCCWPVDVVQNVEETTWMPSARYCFRDENKLEVD